MRNPMGGFWICLSLTVLTGVSALVLYLGMSGYDRAVSYWSMRRGLDEGLVRAIVRVESRGGTDLWRNDFRRLSRQGWAWETVEKFGLDASDWKTWSSIGHGQILYLTATGMGFKGTPETLCDVNTNMKWTTLFLSDKLKRYIIHYSYNIATLHTISAYNAGRVRWNGRYGNQGYVDMVVTEWSNWRRR